MTSATTHCKGTPGTERASASAEFTHHGSLKTALQISNLWDVSFNWTVNLCYMSVNWACVQFRRKPSVKWDSSRSETKNILAA